MDRGALKGIVEHGMLSIAYGLADGKIKPELAEEILFLLRMILSETGVTTKEVLQQ